ncbi:hypothetical protein CKA32_002406 [Geitlerinema sp. FC II]|nr:hypothetical protein CKA32_002406 [Geitlerinema sp. FC II]
MRILLTFIQWFLTAFAIIMVVGFIAMQSIPSAAIALVAVLLLLPPLQGVFESNLAFLKSRVLRIILALVVLLFSPLPLGSSMARLEFEPIALCSQPQDGKCEQNVQQYIQPNSIHLTAVPEEFPDDLPEGEPEIEVAISYESEPNKQTSIAELNATVKEGTPIQLELPLETAGIGSYTVTLSPLTEDLFVPETLRG